MVLNGSCWWTIMKDLTAIQSSGLRVVAVADVQQSASCCKYVKGSGIKIFDDHQGLLAIESLDMILECAGDERIPFDIIRQKPPTVGLLDRQASMRLIEMAKDYAKIAPLYRLHSKNPLASTLLEASPGFSALRIRPTFRNLSGLCRASSPSPRR